MTGLALVGCNEDFKALKPFVFTLSKMKSAEPAVFGLQVFRELVVITATAMIKLSINIRRNRTTTAQIRFRDAREMCRRLEVKQFVGDYGRRVSIGVGEGFVEV